VTDEKFANSQINRLVYDPRHPTESKTHATTRPRPHSAPGKPRPFGEHATSHARGGDRVHNQPPAPPQQSQKRTGLGEKQWKP
jgi:hypothetical protein